MEKGLFKSVCAFLLPYTFYGIRRKKTPAETGSKLQLFAERTAAVPCKDLTFFVLSSGEVSRQRHHQKQQEDVNDKNNNKRVEGPEGMGDRRKEFSSSFVTLSFIPDWKKLISEKESVLPGARKKE